MFTVSIYHVKLEEQQTYKTKKKKQTKKYQKMQYNIFKMNMQQKHRENDKKKMYEGENTLNSFSL